MLLVKLIEPPCTERYARWCERSVGEIIVYLLLDSKFSQSIIDSVIILWYTNCKRTVGLHRRNAYT